MRPTIILTAILGISLPAVASGCATTRTVGEQTDDAIVTSRVAARIARDPELPKHEIDVDVLKGHVTLRGEVPDAHTSMHAERLARETEGVVSVENRLLIVSKTELEDEPDGDGAITARVHDRLTNDPEVKSRNIDVDTQDAVVTLSGIVENERAREEAVRLAADTEGVARVVDELSVDAQM